MSGPPGAMASWTKGWLTNRTGFWDCASVLASDIQAETAYIIFIEPPAGHPPIRASLYFTNRVSIVDSAVPPTVALTASAWVPAGVHLKPLLYDQRELGAVI